MRKRIVHINMQPDNPTIVITHYPGTKQFLYHPTPTNFIRLIRVLTDNPKIIKKRLNVDKFRWTGHIAK